jgi:hypothetical protein
VLVASSSVLLPYDVTLGGVWTLRSTMPFSAIAGRDLNGDALVTDYVPGTTRAMGTRDNARMLEAVNAWRAVNGLRPIAASQIDANRYQGFDSGPSASRLRTRRSQVRVLQGAPQRLVTRSARESNCR